MDPGAFVVRTIHVPAGASLAYEQPDWHDSLVVVAAGQVVLVGSSGATQRWGAGALLALDHLPLASIRNPGTEVVVLLALSRATGLGTAAAASPLPPA